MDLTNTSLSAELERKIDEAIGRYPPDHKRSAAMPLLHLWQEEFGFISDEGVRWIATKLELQPINILELVTFYPMYRQAPTAKKHIRVCRTLSCAMAGSYQVMEKLREAIGENKNCSVEFVECLASCGTAPVCMIDDELHENVRPEHAVDLVTRHSSLVTRSAASAPNAADAAARADNTNQFPAPLSSTPP